jgi:hypothetical protein
MEKEMGTEPEEIGTLNWARGYETFTTNELTLLNHTKICPGGYVTELVIRVDNGEDIDNTSVGNYFTIPFPPEYRYVGREESSTFLTMDTCFIVPLFTDTTNLSKKYFSFIKDCNVQLKITFTSRIDTMTPRIIGMGTCIVQFGDNEIPYGLEYYLSKLTFSIVRFTSVLQCIPD